MKYWELNKRITDAASDKTAGTATHKNLEYGPPSSFSSSSLSILLLLDKLAIFFGFQCDNVRNQRDHLFLHLADAQMRLTPPPDNIDTLDAAVLRRGGSANSEQRRELLYLSFYLLIWGVFYF
ncbi:hypothetical protein PIB30_042520 [Stylosanthes scabra]|uniref:Uncharacterized protein n=1 Tax=Stylosanthes scabra TaxID=79078 RepID=A0ABU6TFF3_9FABA|nr:hypothetical protein [Stylosanthes scabra]